jgi:hypothetical protein
LCTQQASQHSIFCTAADRSTEYAVPAGLMCSQRSTFTYVSDFSQHFLSRSFFSLVFALTVLAVNLLKCTFVQFVHRPDHAIIFLIRPLFRHRSRLQYRTNVSAALKSTRLSYYLHTVLRTEPYSLPEKHRNIAPFPLISSQYCCDISVWFYAFSRHRLAAGWELLL